MQLHIAASGRPHLPLLRQSIPTGLIRLREGAKASAGKFPRQSYFPGTFLPGFLFSGKALPLPVLPFVRVPRVRVELFFFGFILSIKLNPPVSGREQVAQFRAVSPFIESEIPAMCVRYT